VAVVGEGSRCHCHAGHYNQPHLMNRGCEASVEFATMSNY
jgi:hypothetical protein